MILYTDPDDQVPVQHTLCGTHRCACMCVCVCACMCVCLCVCASQPLHGCVCALACLCVCAGTFIELHAQGVCNNYLNIIN